MERNQFERFNIDSSKILEHLQAECTVCHRINSSSQCKTEGCPNNDADNADTWPCMSAEQALYHLQFAFNADRRTEIVIIYTAVLIEALEYDLLKKGIGVLKSGSEQVELQRKLDELKSRDTLIELMVEVFSKNPIQMSREIISSSPCTIDWPQFNEDYTKMSEWRNKIVHEGLFIEHHGEGVPETIERRIVATRIREATLRFIPEILTTFALVWNEYLHKPYWENLKSSQK